MVYVKSESPSFLAFLQTWRLIPFLDMDNRCCAAVRIMDRDHIAIDRRNQVRQDALFALQDALLAPR